MDFFTNRLETDARFDSITTLVDRILKQVRLVPSRTYTALDVSRCFFDNVFRLHGIPDSIVSDRDLKFTVKLWDELMHCCGIRLKISTSRHPQTDGGSQIMNRMFGNSLQCCFVHRQRDWDQLLAAAELS